MEKRIAKKKSSRLLEDGICVIVGIGLAIGVAYGWVWWVENKSTPEFWFSVIFLVMMAGLMCIASLFD